MSHIRYGILGVGGMIAGALAAALPISSRTERHAAIMMPAFDFYTDPYDRRALRHGWPKRRKRTRSAVSVRRSKRSKAARKAAIRRRKAA